MAIVILATEYYRYNNVTFLVTVNNIHDLMDYRVIYCDYLPPNKTQA